ncbi:hypothetical protein ACSBR1_013026 [Camellia fascicularis]
MEAVMGLMRRIPLKHTETALSALLSLLHDHSSHFLSQVGQPLQVLCDVDCGKEFILCEYNRDTDSYRSPWSNKYHPPLEDGLYPSLELRKLEIETNEVFAIYRIMKVAFHQCICGKMRMICSLLLDKESSAPFHKPAIILEDEDGSKSGHGRREDEEMTRYCLTSTVMLSLTTYNDSSGTFNLSAPLHQMQQYYRWLYVPDNCSRKWNALVHCLTVEAKQTSVVEVCP